MPIKTTWIGSLNCQEICEFSYTTIYPIVDKDQFRDKLKRLGVSFSFECKIDGTTITFRYPSQVQEGRNSIITALEDIEKRVVRIMDDVAFVQMFNTKGD